MPNPVFIYSSYCKFCNTFLEIIQKNNIYNNFDRLLIDKQNGKRPDGFYEIQDKLNYKIKEVPTVIFQLSDTKHEVYVLSGNDAFLWLDDYIAQLHNPTEQQPQQEIQKTINPVSVLKQNNDKYTHLNQEQKPVGFQESFKNTIKISPESDDSKKNINLDKKYEEIIAERNALLDKPKEPKNIDFKTGKIEY